MFSMAESWEEVGLTTQKICLKQMTWIDLIKEKKVWNPNKNIKLLERKATRIKENQAAIQAIEKYFHMEEPSQILVPQDMEEDAPSSPQKSRSFRLYKERENSSKAHK
ncbi:hypothetical protein O181_097374 [Austropuccinia psidii MF-1]|uniref:Uncharacterized protein n=1 Tax=Austropuccinia psidii MF-1 TaxID=1389203 RepID=A0A9Q3PDJ8_9BASI|nr:hypothetical protein [Austropuccinia psidii MF-1]